MPKTTEEKSFSIYNGATLLATGGDGAVHMNQWCVQAKVNLVTGAHQLEVGRTYTIVTASGTTLAAMYCDEMPVQTSGFSSFQVGGGLARFSNRKMVDGRDYTYFPTRWTFGHAPGASTGVTTSKVDKSKLSFGDDI